MLEIAICEDNNSYLELLKRYILDILHEERIEGNIISAVTSPADIKECIGSNKANVFFIDIDLNDKVDGYDLAVEIRKELSQSYIVFITEHLEYVFKGYKLHAFDFLPKPATKNIIRQCLIDINNDYKTSRNIYMKRLEIKSGSTAVLVDIEKIVYIEKLGNRVIIHTENGEFSCYRTLESFEKELPQNHFFRCHKSYIANRLYIHEINVSQLEVIFINGQKCYLGRKYKQDVISHANSI